MAQDKETCDRVRELVRQVLASVPAEEDAPDKPKETFPQRLTVNSLKHDGDKEFDRDESAKSLITENDLRGLETGAKLRVAETAKFTSGVKQIAVGADHGGFEYKEQLKNFLTDKGFRVQDFGTNSKDAVDYPDFAHAVAKAVADKTADVGIIIDGAGIGSAMTANKVPGVRAAACYSVTLAKNSREHNGANVLTLGSGQSSLAEVKKIVEAFVTSELTEERHKKRVSKIEAIERQYKA
jgi:ribose 5-phosphate isomerase B